MTMMYLRVLLILTTCGITTITSVSASSLTPRDAKTIIGLGGRHGSSSWVEEEGNKKIDGKDTVLKQSFYDFHQKENSLNSSSDFKVFNKHF